MKQLAPDATALHRERTAIDVLLGERRGRTLRPKRANAHVAALREFARSDPWRSAGAGWSLHVEFPRGGSAALSLLLTQRGDGTFVGTRVLRAEASVLIWPPKGRETEIERLAPTIRAAGYHGGRGRAKSTKQGKRVSRLRRLHQAAYPSGSPRGRAAEPGTARVGACSSWRGNTGQEAFADLTTSWHAVIESAWERKPSSALGWPFALGEALRRSGRAPGAQRRAVCARWRGLARRPGWSTAAPERGHRRENVAGRHGWIRIPPLAPSTRTPYTLRPFRRSRSETRLTAPCRPSIVICCAFTVAALTKASVAP